jgi:hypothetical protein
MQAGITSSYATLRYAVLGTVCHAVAPPYVILFSSAPAIAAIATALLLLTMSASVAVSTERVHWYMHAH